MRPRGRKLLDPAHSERSPTGVANAAGSLSGRYRREKTRPSQADGCHARRRSGLQPAGRSGRCWHGRTSAAAAPRAHRAPFVQNAGTIRQTAGDLLLALFDSIEGAVQSAIAIQRGVATLDKDAPSNQRIRFRIGINIGDAILEEVDMHGDGVNIAVRLESCVHQAASASRAQCVTTPATSQIYASSGSAR